MTNFERLIEQGHAAVAVGRFSIGIRDYDHAYRIAVGYKEQASALQNKGIALRLANDLLGSESALQGARAIAVATEDFELVGRIERDIGMTILDRATMTEDRGQFADAEMWFDESWKKLKVIKPLEAAMTIGFIGRSFFCRGERSDAIALLVIAHKALTGKHDVYELNNLIWLARASVFYRWRFAPRFLHLVSQTDHTRRNKEYLVLLVGGNRLYKFLRERRR